MLKHTSELRGEPSAPDVDPYWNREFGYGVVDALAAVELAIFLHESGQSGSINPKLQNHGLNFSKEGAINITGHAWGQDGPIERVDFRIDDGEWQEATYSISPEEIGALTPFLWYVLLDPEKLPIGQHTVEVHAVSGGSHSLPVFFDVVGAGSGSSTNGIPPEVVGLVALVAFAWIGSLVLIRYRSDDQIEGLLSSFKRQQEQVIDAEIVE